MKKLNISHEYNIELWNGSVCDQGDTKKDWIYSALNPMRHKLSIRLDMKQKNFQLSTNYILYFDLFEKCCDMILGKNPIEAVSDSGSWERFSYLAKKYGIAPLSAMPDVHCSHNGELLYTLNNRLMYAKKELEEGTGDSKAIIACIVKLLNNKLGTPPKTFSLTYMDKSGNINVIENVTPLDFYAKYINVDLRSYSVVSNNHLLKELVTKQLEGGEQVVVCADTRHQANQMLGILDTDFIDNTDMFGEEVYMSREDKIKYGIIKPYAYLTIDGVQVENSKPVRFKAQDSHGGKTGADGHYTMSSSWFDEYVLYAVIKRE